MKRKPLTKKQKIMAMAGVVAGVGVGVVGYYLGRHLATATIDATDEGFAIVHSAIEYGTDLGRDNTLNKIFDSGEKGYYFTSPEHGRCLFKATRVS